MSYFQIIDQKNNCPSIYVNGKIINVLDEEVCKRTWAYSSTLEGKDVDFGQILANGKNIEECCPDVLKEKWNEIKKEHSYFNNAFKESKINLKEHCFYDLVPEAFIHKYFGIKNEITKYVFETTEKQSNYDFLKQLNSILFSISKKELNLDLDYLNKFSYDPRVVNVKKKLNKVESRINYNLFGTITGRLTTKVNSFPILTLDKKFRSIVKPNNDWFVEFDFNAAELRTFLALNEKKQPTVDIHEWHLNLFKQKFSENIDRDEIKKRFFAWFYSGKNDKFDIPEIDEAYDRNNILKCFWDGNNAITPFGRKIETDERKAIPTVIQSTSSDVFFERVIKVSSYLKDRKLKSCISALIHDSMILDFARDEIKELDEIVNIFSNTIYGKYMTKVQIGKNLGEMKLLMVR